MSYSCFCRCHRFPRNAGLPWYPHDDERMRNYVRIYREHQIPVAEGIRLLMDRFGRSYNSIYCRLLKLDLITE